MPTSNAVRETILMVIVTLRSLSEIFCRFGRTYWLLRKMNKLFE